MILVQFYLPRSLFDEKKSETSEARTTHCRSVWSVFASSPCQGSQCSTT